MQNDLTFFTNDPGSTLLDRFQRTLRDVKFFDILVGYFRTSGFDSLHESFASIDKIRILVGLNVDRQAVEIVDAFHSQSTLDFESHKLGVLNSKLLTFMFSKTSSEISGGFFQWKRQYMEHLPIFPATTPQKSPIIECVRKILSDPDSPSIPRLESEIDDLVYTLYGLMKDEISLVEAK